MKNIHGYEIDPPTPESQRGLPMAPMMASAQTQARQPPSSFYGSMAYAFAMPLRGKGLHWLMVLATFTIFAMFVLIGARFMPFVGFILQLIVLAALLTLNARYFLATFSAAAYEDDEPAPPPGFDQIRDQLILPGFILMAWTITAYMPLYLWISNQGAAVRSGGPMVMAMILFFLPYFLWPTALVRMTSGSVAAMWNVPSIVMSIFRAPLKYTLVVALGVVAGLAPLALSWILGSSRMGFIGGMISLFASSVSLAYCHGVMGVMMGVLVQEHPEMLPKEARTESEWS